LGVRVLSEHVLQENAEQERLIERLGLKIVNLQRERESLVQQLQQQLEIDESNWRTANTITVHNMKEKADNDAVLAYSNGRIKLAKHLLKVLGERTQ